MQPALGEARALLAHGACVPVAAGPDLQTAALGERSGVVTESLIGLLL